MKWTQINVRIHWQRCRRRRWPASPRLALGPEERRKQSNVLLYWWAGEGLRELPGGRVAIHAGVCHWARPGWTYKNSQSLSDPLGVTAIHFDLLDQRGRTIPPTAVFLPPEQLHVRNAGLVDAITRHVADRAMNLRARATIDPSDEKAVTALFRGLLMMLDHDTPVRPSDRQPREQRRMADITAHIHEHIASLLTVDALAKHWGLTRSHFSRIFFQHTGLSPKSYIINAQVALASELLEQSESPIGEIAAQAGYPDIFRFSRQFKRVTGLSPSAFRLSCLR